MESVILRSSIRPEREVEKLKAVVLILKKEVEFYRNELELCIEPSRRVFKRLNE